MSLEFLPYVNGTRSVEPLKRCVSFMCCLILKYFGTRNVIAVILNPNLRSRGCQSSSSQNVKLYFRLPEINCKHEFDFKHIVILAHLNRKCAPGYRFLL